MPLQDLYLDLDGARRVELLEVVSNRQFRELIAQDLGRIRTQLCNLDTEQEDFKAAYRNLNTRKVLYLDLLEWMEFVRTDILEESNHVDKASEI